MNVDEIVKQNPEELEKILDEKKDDIIFALKDFGQKLDVVIWGALKECADKENAEVNISKIAEYKNAVKIITQKTDAIINDFLMNKRSAYN